MNASLQHRVMEEETMVVPSIIICPICGKRTYLRIQNGGYMYEYPIRVYCLNCHALMKGVFVMDSSAGPMGLTMFNAKAETPRPQVGATREIDADYIAEVSGELPCAKVAPFDGKIRSDSPFLNAVDQINMPVRIEQLREFYSKMEEWARWKSIAFQLLSEDEMDYVPAALHNKMGSYPYECSDYLKSLHCLQEVVREETSYLFVSPTQENAILQLIELLSGIDRQQLHLFVERIGGVNEIKAAYRKVIDAFSSFMQVYQNLLPAETYQSYKWKDDPNLGIATCSFSDIKGFYQDAYETLLSIMHIPVSIDNILVRGNYLHYNSAYSDFYNSKPQIKSRYGSYLDDFVRYSHLDNGKKAELMMLSSEQIQKVLNVPVNKDLRNAITHNTFKYDGLTQIIIVFDQKKPSQVNLTMSLLDMAIDCLGLAKSIVLFAELILFILRNEEENYHSIIHPRYYKNPGRNDQCPCGSGKKYKNCCIRDIEQLQKETHCN